MPIKANVPSSLSLFFSQAMSSIRNPRSVRSFSFAIFSMASVIDTDPLSYTVENIESKIFGRRYTATTVDGEVILSQSAGNFNDVKRKTNKTKHGYPEYLAAQIIRQRMERLYQQTQLNYYPDPIRTIWKTGLLIWQAMVYY